MPAPSGIALILCLYYTFLAAFIFLPPGAAIAALIASRTRMDRFQFAGTGIVASAGVAYLMFWVYLSNPYAGRAVSLILPIASFAVLAARWRTLRVSGLYLEYRDWVAATALTMLLYTFAGFICQYPESIDVQMQRRFLPGDRLPPDNVLPLLLATGMYQGQPVRPFLFADWKSSDRPPLQAGAALMQLPWGRGVSQALRYQFLATFLQTLWVAGLGLFLRRAGVERRRIVLVMFFCVLSAFFLLHSIYVWPKLLATALAFVGLAFTPLVEEKGANWSRFDTTLAGAALALALLSHSAIVFTLMVAVPACVLLRGLPRLRVWLPGAAIALMLLLPWNLYQKYYDPPGDRLLKWHLAGVADIDGRTFSQALADSYGKLTLEQYAANKWGNAKSLFVNPENLNRAEWADNPLRQWVVGNFFCFFQAPGLLLPGMFARIFSVFGRRKALPDQTLPLADRLTAISLISVVVWCLLLFMPGSTWIHAGSLANVALLFTAFTLYVIILLPWWAVALLLLLQGVSFAVYCFAKFLAPFDNANLPVPVLRWDMTLAGVCAFGLLLASAWRYSKRRRSEDYPTPSCAGRSLPR